MVHQIIWWLQQICHYEVPILAWNKNKESGRYLVNMLPVRPIKVHNLLQKNQTYVWYQDDISLAKHRLVVPFQFETTRKNKLKYPNIVDKKQWKGLGKEGQKNGINTSDTK